ncbi:hypothetical protein [Sphingosinithalassobacter sp. CS137]|uniref:hypothetical protein n=1 Tax=Sphingosinithalassobacter sp. CS137 TaxID=2762748 RepID=UPI00165DDE0C|nr:hypothetical protein [Sphingosinithalassobacter sp. CS137]
MKRILAASALALSFAACSPAPEESAAGAPNAMVTAEIGAADGSDATANAAAPAAGDPVLTLEGLGALRIGQPVPTDSSWAVGGAQEADACAAIRSPDYPGVYAIVERGAVRRITVAEGSDVKLIEGIGVGASESAVRADFAGFREEPHKYVAAPAKYLTAPNADSGDPALRFEIGERGTVTAIHIGTMPVLGYVEGCG